MSIADNITEVRERISSAAYRSGRKPEEITLIAVTKTVDASRVMEAFEAGITDAGENYLQDAAGKFDVAGRVVRWHMIGHLQTNKVRQAVQIFDLIQSVDCLSLAQEIVKRSAALGKSIPVLVEVNISGEESKFGVRPEEALSLCEDIAGIEGAKLKGLMGIAPFTDDQTAIRRSFAVLKGLWDELPLDNRKHLSMGMTSDFEMAIEEGSTMVRVGTAIFGPRH